MKRENIRLGFYLWISQFALAWICSFLDWHHLVLWDARWYTHIVENGYSATLSPPPDQGVGNVGFFPGYPLLGWIFKNLFQVSAQAGLLIASNASAFLAWTYFAEYLDLRQSSRKLTRLIWMWIYPFSFFMVAAYSDSLGAAMLFGFILFTEKWLALQPTLENKHLRWTYFGFIALHGYAMTFTRVIPVVMIVYPLIRALQLRQPLSIRAQSILLGLIAAGGALTFFVYCQLKFGAWNFYFISERVIWGWGAVFQWDRLLPPTALFDFTRPTRGDTTGKYVTILFGAYFVYLAIHIFRNRLYRDIETALLITGGMFWGAYLVGRSTWGFSGMGRYLIPLIPLFIPGFHLPTFRSVPTMHWSRKLAWGFLILFLFVLEVVYAAKFARNGWVA